MAARTLSVYLIDKPLLELDLSGVSQPVFIKRFDELQDHVILHLHAASSIPNGWLVRHDSPTPTDDRQIIRILDQDSEYPQVEFIDGNHVLIGTLWDLPPHDAIFKRHRGILELDTLSRNRVLIVGIGSVGSTLAVELAKSGIGRLGLCDPDRLESHNIARHACDLNDLGRLKVHAVADLVRAKNPYLTVDLLPYDPITNQEAFIPYFVESDLIITVTDTPESRRFVNRLALEHSKHLLYGALSARAMSAQVLRVRPNQGPCYTCFESYLGAEDPPRNSEIPYGGDEREAKAQPGLSVDIMPLVQMLAKLTIQQLVRGESEALSSLNDDLIYDYYLWINRRNGQFAGLPPWGQGTISIQRWMPMNVPVHPNCPTCRLEAYMGAQMNQSACELEQWTTLDEDTEDSS